MELTDFAKGKCMQMCPLAELQMREKERLLHRLEILPGTEGQKTPKADPKRTVKAFRRSAADTRAPSPNQLRPFAALKQTIQHLLKEIIGDERVPTLSLFDFICDRLRAVRQDMTIQALPADQCIELLEPMVNFHLIFGYKLCELSFQNFDPILNKKHFTECLKLLLVCYDDLEKQCYLNHVVEPKKSSNLKLDKEVLDIDSSDLSTRISRNRPIMEATYILYNIEDTSPLLRFLQLPNKFRTKVVRTAFEIALSNQSGNFIRTCRSLPCLPVTAACALALQLPTIQRKALFILCHSFHNKTLTYPAEHLQKVLAFASLSDLSAACQHYGISVQQGQVHFNKAHLKIDARMLSPKRLQYLDTKLQGISFIETINYK